MPALFHRTKGGVAVKSIGGLVLFAGAVAVVVLFLLPGIVAAWQAVTPLAAVLK